MNNLINDVIKEYKKDINKVEIHKNAIIFNADNKYVAKKSSNDIIKNYEYLQTRDFNYIPKIVFNNNFGYIYEYQEDTYEPDNQKLSDLIKMTALLHNKTTYDKDLSLDDIKIIYEDIKNKIENTYNYYNDLIDSIELSRFYSPSSYILIRNCSTLFNTLSFCTNKLEEWYQMMNELKKVRYAFINNNLDINHVIKNSNTYLISWNKSKFDYPIKDLIILYKKYYNKIDFSNLFKDYEKIFKLTKEEKILLYIYLFIPDKIYLNKDELTNTINISNLFNYLYKTDRLFMKNEATNKKDKTTNINK